MNIELRSRTTPFLTTVRFLTYSAFFLCTVWSSPDSFACQPGNEAIQLLAEYQEAWNLQDTNRIAALYLNDATKIDARGPKLNGREEISEAYATLFQFLSKEFRLAISLEATSAAGKDGIVASGYWKLTHKRGVVLFSGHLLSILKREASAFRFSDLRLAISWKRPADFPDQPKRNSGNEDVSHQDSIKLTDVENGIVNEIRRLWCSNVEEPEISMDFANDIHIVDAQGRILVGPAQVVGEMRKRQGARQVVAREITVRGDVAIVEGELTSKDTGLLGLPRVDFTAVCHRNGERWRFVSQINRAPSSFLANHERWAPTIDSFGELDEKTRPPKSGIVFVGDSDIVKCDIDRWFPESEAINRGFGGSQIDDVVHYLQEVLLKHEPRIAVFSCGGNDIVRGKSAEDVYRDFTRFADAVFAKLPNCQIVVTSQHTPPLFLDMNDIDARIRKLNSLIQSKAAKDKRITFLPETRKALHDENDKPDTGLYSNDKVHFDVEGYRRWTAVIQPHLEIDETRSP